MKTHLQLIRSRLLYLERMRIYLLYTTHKIEANGLLDKSPIDFSLGDPHNLAAFRIRVSKFQEHLEKLLTSIAREEEVKYTCFSDVLAFTEKEGILQSEVE
ncbi:hypothetical protein CCP3SC1_790019 [Gammaproteobacteria bacterium]